MRLKSTSWILLSCALLFGCSKDAPSETTATVKEAAMEAAGEPDLVMVAATNGSFNTLVAAVKAAGLVDTLQGEGPFTLFAPTDAAFAKLPAGTVDSLLLPENKDQLVAILTYHVVAGEVMASEVVSLSTAQTVQGQDLAITTDDMGVHVNDANVTATDVMASNGVIHVIDTVLIPAS